MIVKQELVKKIKEHFDLNIYETKVWIALLSKGIASAGEIAELSGVPRSRTYDVLESLEKRGFAIVKIGKPVKYIAVKPTEVIEKIKSNTMNDAQERVKSLSNLKSTQEYVELEDLHNTGIAPINHNELSGSIRGRSNIVSRLREMLENSEKEIMICTTVSDFEDKSRVLIPTIEKLMKNNIKVKIALSGPIDRIKKIGLKFDVKVKSIDSNARIFVSDKKEVLFMITPDNSDEELGLWLNSPFFINSLSMILDSTINSNNPK